MWEELRFVNEPGPEGGILKIKTIKKERNNKINDKKFKCIPFKVKV